MQQESQNHLLDAQGCIAALFPRRPPALRTFRQWQARGWLPYKKVGRLTFFDANEVRVALDKRFSVKAELY